MAAERDPLDPIIGAILDGNDVAWPAADDTEFPQTDRQLLEPLRILAAIAAQSQSGREIPPPASGEGRFELKGLLGRGAFGEVHRAWDGRLHRDVALKILPLDRPFAASVLAEARRLARVRHPGVVTIFDVFEDRDTGRICMELLTGSTLDSVVRESGVFSADGASQIGAALCAALDAVHGVGLVHGDVKAHNVMLETSGRVVLMDLGAGLEAGGAAVREGTPLYMAPELFEGGAAQPQSDIFSLGVLIFHLVTGGYPVAARGMEDVGAAIREGVFSRAARLRVPAPLNRIVARAVDVDPARRFGSAAEMGRALAGSARWDRRLPLAAVLAAAGLATAGLAAWKWTGDPADSHAGVTWREIVLPDDATGPGTLSEDALELVVHARERRLLLLDLRSGSSRVIARSDATGSIGERASFRPGHGTIVYPWAGKACDCFELREVSRDGAAPRALLSGFKAARFELVSLSADGMRLLIDAPPGGDARKFHVLDLTRSTSRPIPGPQTGVHGAALSPDGRFVVFDAPAGPGDLAGDLHIVDVETGERRPLVTGPADDMFPLWTSDGRRVLFSSNRAGAGALWGVAVDRAGAAGEPAIVQPNLGQFLPLSLGSNSLLFWTAPLVDIEMAPFDAATGSVTGAARALPATIRGSNHAPEWSPDGGTVIYSSERRVMGAARSVLVLHTLATGRERELRVPVNGHLDPVWSPDGSSLLVRGPDALDGTRGARIVDVADGSIRQFFPFPLTFRPAWAPDGQDYFYLGPDGLHRMRRDAARPERVAIQGSWQLQSLALSHDGKHVAAAAVSGDRTAILTAPAHGGEPRILVTGSADQAFVVAGWTPDGQRLLAVRRVPQASPELRELVTVSLADGTIAPAGLQRPGLASVRLRPDGGAIVYRTGVNRRTLWLIENLPGETRAR